jgi:hypothetical protein
MPGSPVPQKKMLVLEIAVPDWFADDLDERVDLLMKDLEEDRAEATRYLVVEEMLDAEQVVVTALTIPIGMDDRHELAHSQGRIVGARVVNRDAR